jgi:hypothetical protein
MPSNSNNQGLLSSWKEIADYLGCDERTCRRWELDYGLPVHRMEGAAKSRVCAYKDELDAWRKSRLNGNGAATGAAASAASHGVQADALAPRDHPHTGKSKRIVLWLIPLAAIIVTTAVLLIRSSPGQPADFKIKGSTLLILDKKGKELWDFDTKLEDLSGQKYQRRFQNRERDPAGTLVLPYLVIKDINRCGRNEVLFCPKTQDELYETGLFCFDHRGKERWHYRPGSELRFGEHIYSEDYRIFGIEPFDINNDGFLEVFLVTRHQPHSPSGLVVLDCRGKVLGEFINWGQIHDFAYADRHADGKMEVIIVGLNDEYGKGFLAVFDSSRISGSSPQSERYECKNCVPGSEKYYILFPRTDVDIILKPDKVAIEEIHLLKNNRIELQTQISHIFFELDFNFQVQDVKGSDIFRLQHRDLKAAGKISSELNDAYYENLKKGVLYWDGTQWTSTPTMNRNSDR